MLNFNFKFALKLIGFGLLFILFISIVFTDFIFGQTPFGNFIECPRYMYRDSLNTDTRIVRDIWFNTSDDSSRPMYNHGAIDLDIYPRCIGGDADDDTLTVEVYALKLKCFWTDRIKDIEEGRYTVTAFDSVRITSTLPADTTLHSYALDKFWGSDMSMMDGVRVIYKNQGGNDLGGLDDGDSVIVDSNLRVYDITGGRN